MKPAKVKTSTKTETSKAKSAKQRIRETPKHRSLRLSRKKLKQHKPIPGALRLLKDTFSLLKSNKRLFIGITLLNAFVSFVFVQGFSGTFDVAEFKDGLADLVDGRTDQFGVAIEAFGYMIASAGTSASETAGIYQGVWSLMTGLAIIWAIRQIKAGEKPGMKESYYKGMYPLVPFLLVLLVIGIQLVPLILGNLMFSTIIQNGLAVTVIEKLIFLMLFLLLALLSAYMLVSSLFSLYIVTLPDMTPLRALRSARELVLHRRWAVGIRIVALPVVLLIVAAVVFVPMIVFFTPLVEVLFLLFTSAILAVVHAYMYLLYRSLL